MTTRAKVKKPKTLRQVLNMIDVELAKQTPVSKQLWNVLSALRGPDDSQEYSLKANGTVPIRRAAFPKTAKKAKTARTNDYMQMPGFINGADFSGDLARVAVAGQTHAAAHIRLAARELGILDKLDTGGY